MIEAGQKFGRLMAVSLANFDGKNRMAYWLFKCDCGTEKVVRVAHAAKGLTLSCGCIKRERQTRHGLHGTPEYYVWAAMIERCHNPNSTNAENYGARGIFVCERWHDFANFIADMGARPTAKHSLERDDNNGPYDPGNCRWATRKEQARNNRRNKTIPYKGRQITLAEAAEIAGVDPSTMWRRIDNGWPPERAVETPPTK